MKVRWNGVGIFETTDGVTGFTFSPDVPEQEVSDELGAFLCARHGFEEVEPDPEPEQPPARAKRSRKEEPEPAAEPEPAPEPEPDT